MDGESKHSDFLRLFLKHESDLRAFVGSVVRDVHAREDLLQEVSLALLESFARFDEAQSFGAWARGIAANKMKQGWDKTKRCPVAMSPESINALADAFERREPTASEQLEALERCVESLPEKPRRLMMLRYGQSLALSEIADRVEATLSAVSKAMARIRLRLKECVERRLAAERSTH